MSSNQTLKSLIFMQSILSQTSLVSKKSCFFLLYSGYLSIVDHDSRVQSHSGLLLVQSGVPLVDSGNMGNKWGVEVCSLLHDQIVSRNRCNCGCWRRSNGTEWVVGACKICGLLLRHSHGHSRQNYQKFHGDFSFDLKTKHNESTVNPNLESTDYLETVN